MKLVVSKSEPLNLKEINIIYGTEKFDLFKTTLKAIKLVFDNWLNVEQDTVHFAYGKFEREMLKERTKKELEHAREEGRIGVRKPKLKEVQRKK